MIQLGKPTSRYNIQLVGYLSGFIFPLLVLIGQWLYIHPDIALTTFIKVAKLRGSLASVLSLCLVPNLLVFFIFIWTNWLKAAQGTLGATIALSILVFIVKFCF